MSNNFGTPVRGANWCRSTFVVRFVKLMASMPLDAARSLSTPQ
jgi:hypothetical protein